MGEESTGYSDSESEDSSSVAVSADSAEEPQSYGGATPSDDDLIQQCMQLYDQQDYRGAIAVANQIIESPSGHADEWMVVRAKYGVVMCHDRLQEYNQAADVLQQILDDNQMAGHVNRSAYKNQLMGYSHGISQDPPLGI